MAERPPGRRLAWKFIVCTCGNNAGSFRKGTQHPFQSRGPTSVNYVRLETFFFLWLHSSFWIPDFEIFLFHSQKYTNRLPIYFISRDLMINQPLPKIFADQNILVTIISILYFLANLHIVCLIIKCCHLVSAILGSYHPLKLDFHLNGSIQHSHTWPTKKSTVDLFSDASIPFTKVFLCVSMMVVFYEPSYGTWWGGSMHITLDHQFSPTFLTP